MPRVESQGAHLQWQTGWGLGSPGLQQEGAWGGTPFEGQPPAMQAPISSPLSLSSPPPTSLPERGGPFNVQELCPTTSWCREPPTVWVTSSPETVTSVSLPLCSLDARACPAAQGRVAASARSCHLSWRYLWRLTANLVSAECGCTNYPRRFPSPLEVPARLAPSGPRRLSKPASDMKPASAPP